MRLYVLLAAFSLASCGPQSPHPTDIIHAAEIRARHTQGPEFQLAAGQVVQSEAAVLVCAVGGYSGDRGGSSLFAVAYNYTADQIVIAPESDQFAVGDIRLMCADWEAMDAAFPEPSAAMTRDPISPGDQP
ncbi:hypothetical protein [Oceanicaulis sp.]|uniref:hypothetical protein n=1 Tax=Oceanicaulis sp. TaxID=1924941 RepID=UPI003D2DE8C0